MITKHCLTSEWINEVSAKYNNADKVLVEKVIRALLLLEGLAESKLPFVFKGGTALMLLLNSSKRLSIDIDIIMPDNKGLDAAVLAIVNAKGFTKAVLQDRKTRYNIEKAHYKFYYTSIFPTVESKGYVLLGALFEKAQYQSINPVPMHTPFVKHEQEVLKVQIPSFNDLLGDKLTAFAPFTTGIPYEKSGNCKALEIIKQLYDIGCLFDEADDLAIISKTFHVFAATELGYRNLPSDCNTVLEDIFQTSLLICTRGMAGTGNLKALMTGVSQVRHFMLSGKYPFEKSITHAAKAAYLAKLIHAKSKTMERFDPLFHSNDGIIQQPFFTKLNKLKKSDPEAFFYWYKIYEMLN